MANFNYKQLIYAGMLAMASVDEGVGKLIHWESDRVSLNKIIVADLNLFSSADQKEAYESICQFILFKIELYNKSAKPQEKGGDEERVLINRYREYADELYKELKFQS